jgi:hypothetical protein
MLNIIKKYYEERENEEEKLAEIEKVKKDIRFEPKIKYASEILPSFLKPYGRNPFSILYKILSTGIHGKSDEECLKIVNEIIVAFEFVFKNLSSSIEENKKYLNSLNILNKPELKEDGKKKQVNNES